MPMKSELPCTSRRKLQEMKLELSGGPQFILKPNGICRNPHHRPLRKSVPSSRPELPIEEMPWLVRSQSATGRKIKPRKLTAPEKRRLELSRQQYEMMDVDAFGARTGGQQMQDEEMCIEVLMSDYAESSGDEDLVMRDSGDELDPDTI